MSERKDLGRRVIRVNWSLLGEWWCAPADMPEDQIVAAIQKEVDLPVGTLGIALVKDRLYGGFHCAEDPGRRHIYLATGEYTYQGTNTFRTPEERAETWANLIPANEHLPNPGDGPFTADRPLTPAEPMVQSDA